MRTEYFPVALESFKDIDQKGGIVMNGSDQHNHSKRGQSNRHIYLKVSKSAAKKGSNPGAGRVLPLNYCCTWSLYVQGFGSELPI